MNKGHQRTDLKNIRYIGRLQSQLTIRLQLLHIAAARYIPFVYKKVIIDYLIQIL
jgi:hypothetical protein